MASAQEPAWPPKSPHEALMSTPGGRNRMRRLYNRESPSPSPIKRSKSVLSAHTRVDEAPPSGDDEEDEETLQLQLQEIQARLRLKKLQKKSRQSAEEGNLPDQLIANPTKVTLAASRAQSRVADVSEENLPRARPHSTIDVPASPVRRLQPEETQRSPSRVLLGIDKGLRGSDVSLRKAPSLRRNLEKDFRSQGTEASRLQRSRSQTSPRRDGTATGQDKPQSFSERMAAVRVAETERSERQARIKQSRSTSFHLAQGDIEEFKNAAVDFPDLPSPARAFSRADILNAKQKDATITRSKTVSDLRATPRTVNTESSSTLTSARPHSQMLAGRPPSQAASSQPSTASEASEPGHFDSFSRLHLTKRLIPHSVLTRTLTGKKVFLLPDLLQAVKGPDFDPPDIEEDMVIFGIVAQKSEPRAHQAQANNQNDKRGKYMIMSLTDLKWELELFLFDGAFDQFWRIAPGTIVAILNPGIMPPPRGKTDTGRFSLTLNSSDATLLEVGHARDLGFCKSVKKDGKVCASWVDKRHTEFCEFHVNAAITKNYSGRMEINGGGSGKLGLRRGGGRWAGGGRGGGGSNAKDSSTAFSQRRKDDEGRIRYDRESHTQFYVSGRTPAALLDDVDFDPDPFHRGSTKEERLQRRVLAREREHDIARKLGMAGSGAGADYLRSRTESAATSVASDKSKEGSSITTSAGSSTTTAPPSLPDAAALGLLRDKRAASRLSPVKRKRGAPSGAENSGAMGWGSDLSKRLGRMRDGESLQPVRKKTRFVTENGIREAGRESLGGEVGANAAGGAVTMADESSDDGLDIV